jgi:hypothetical protein
MDKRQRIVAILRSEYERSTGEYRKAHAERVGRDAAANAWEKFNPDDGIGGRSQNPHSSSRLTDREEEAKFYAAQMRETYEFAVDTFIGAIGVGSCGG